MKNVMKEKKLRKKKWRNHKKEDQLILQKLKEKEKKESQD